jgi:phage major head subunit gpT-like protein
MGAEKLSSRAIQGMFFERLAQNTGAAWLDAVSILVNSDQDSEEYPWLGMTPQMREWVGGRNAKGFKENGITIVNKHYEATIEFLIKELRRDKTGQVRARINELADRAQSHWAKLLSTLIVNGESTVCYDGEYFFDTDHSEGSSGTQSNDLSVDISALATSVHGTTTNPSAGEMSISIQLAVQAILGFKDDQGEPFNESASDFLVMGPPSLQGPILAAINNQFLASGELNTIITSAGDLFRIRPVINPRLSSWTEQFAVFRADGATKPFIRQEETPVVLKVKDENSEFAFDNDMVQYGIDTWRNVDYGMWQHACLVTMID